MLQHVRGEPVCVDRVPREGPDRRGNTHSSVQRVDWSQHSWRTGVAAATKAAYAGWRVRASVSARAFASSARRVLSLPHQGNVTALRYVPLHRSVT